MSRFRRVSAALLAAAAVAVLARPASAAPVNSPRAEEILVTCPRGDIGVVSAPGNGDFTPGFIVGTHQVLVPYRFVFTVTGGDRTFTVTEAKKAPLPTNTITCTFTGKSVVDGTSYTFTGTVTAVLRGKP